MPLQCLHVRGYRSLRDFKLSLGPVNIITGANGTGKSNLYQALMLVARAARVEFARGIAEDGGTASMLWAGGERIRYNKKRPPKRFQLAVETESGSFSFAAGVPSPSSLPPGRSLFGGDPEVKEEKLWLLDDGKRVLMLDRRGPSTWLRKDEAALAQAIDHAFRGARLRVDVHDTLFSIHLEVPGILRPLNAREFSDGQLRFLCLCAALLSPRPSALIALNEPRRASIRIYTRLWRS